MKEKIRVLFVVNDLGVGGVQRLVVDFANFIRKDCFEVNVATLLRSPESDFLKNEVHEDVQVTSFSFKSFWDMGEWLKFYKFMKRNKFDVVFTQLFMADTIGRSVAYLTGVPVIITEIQNIIPNLPKKFIFVDKILAYITDACISTALAVTNYATSVIKFPPQKIVEIATNVVDERRFKILPDKENFRKSINIPSDAKIVINIGRLVSQKGQSVFLKASKEIISKKDNVYFLIVGSGRLEEQLKKEARALGVDRKIKFLGARKDTPELLINSDVFAFPSLWEGQGLILFEAIFSKIPIVASNTGGIPEVVKDGVTGLLVEPGNDKDLAENILQILKDCDLGEKLANQAYDRFKGRTLENSVRGLEKVFKSLFDKKKKNR